MKKKGFTLVELLVVISIIGILTIVLVSSFTSIQKKSRDIKRKSELNSVAKALQMYYSDVGRFPNYDAVLRPDDPNINSLWNGGEFAANNTVYMKKMPGDPKLTTQYYYEVSSTGKSYNVFANLETTTDFECRHDGSGLGMYYRNGIYYCYGISSPNAFPGQLVN